MDFQIVTDWGLTGLVGTINYQLLDANNTSIVGPTTTGIAEYPAGSGQYYVKVTWNPNWTGIKAVWNDGTRTAQEWIPAPSDLLFNGVYAVTLVFEDSDSIPIPSVAFTVVGVGSSVSDLTGHRTLNLNAGTYEIRPLASGGNTWDSATITVSADHTFTLVANPASTPGTPVLSLSGISAADDYFTTRLYTNIWFAKSDTDKQRALNDATRIIDRLNYKGTKTEPDQFHEVPRSGLTMQRIAIDPTVIPDDFLFAQYEIAFALLKGYDPEKDNRSLGVLSRGYSSVRIAYDPTQVPDYIKWGIPSLMAWQYLLPYLDDSANTSIRLRRVS